MVIRPFRFARDVDVVRPFASPYSSLQKEMNRLMETFFTDAETPLEESTFSPSLDIAEEEKGFHVHLELPGMTEQDVELSFEKGVLRIKGEKKDVREEKGKNFTRTERTFGSFYRAIPFSTEVDDSKIEAHFDKGILNIYLPKAAQALREAKKITIKPSK